MQKNSPTAIVRRNVLSLRGCEVLETYSLSNYLTTHTFTTTILHGHHLLIPNGLFLKCFRFFNPEEIYYRF
jgi:hypothetical protein